MTTKELEGIEQFIKTRQAANEPINIKEIKKIGNQVGPIFERYNVLSTFHDLLHEMEVLMGCKLACANVVLNAFLFGYECRKGIEEQDELFKLFAKD